jgi:hypothetical protein
MLHAADGQIHTMEVTGTALFAAPGQPIGTLGIMHDVTDRKKSEGEIREKIEEMEQLNQLMVGREIKMSELKNRVRELEEKLNETKP